MNSYVFKEPTRKIQESYLQIDSIVKSIDNIMKARIEKEKSQFVKVLSSLDALSPLKTLTRGYSIVEKEGNIVRKKEELKQDDDIVIRLSDGKITAKVQNLNGASK